MSGASVAPWAVYTNRYQAYNHTKMLATEVGCYTDEKNQSPREIIQCLNSRTSIQLSETVVVVKFVILIRYTDVTGNCVVIVSYSTCLCCTLAKNLHNRSRSSTSATPKTSRVRAVIDIWCKSFVGA